MFRSVLCCAALLASATEAARILGVFITPSYSHQTVYQPIWKELSLRGHQVTVLTPNPLKDPTLTNLTEIDLSFSYEQWDAHSIATLGTKEHSSTEEVKKLSEAYISVSEAQLSHPKVQALIRDPDARFDLIIVEFLWPLMYGFKDVFNCPMVGVTSLGLTGTAYESIGNPNHPALNPDLTLPFAKNLGFKERVISTVYNFVFSIGCKFTLHPKLNAMAAKYFGQVRPMDVIAKEVSLVIVNSNLALRNVIPVVPAYVEITGIHIKETKPLPHDLRAVLDNATEGVIYFSLGSNIKSHLLPKEQLDMFLEAFAELPYKILWKFEDEHLPNKPKNVEIRHWLPQQDVLGHPNVKLFVTQGGLQSLDEAIHKEVPILTIPFFGDQRFNTHYLVESGAALSINFHSFTKEEFKEKVTQLLTKPEYKSKIQKLGRIVKDQPMPALEKAVWWIEYVLRHEGAEHLQYGAIHMPFYQYFLLDVSAFLLAAISLIVYVLLRIFKHVVLCYNLVRKCLKAVSCYVGGKRSHAD